MTKNIELLIEKIKNAKSIAISGHKNPDGDSLGSALALMKIIELNFGKKPDVIYDGNIPRFLGNIPLRDDARFYKHIPEDAKYDLYILVDYGTKKNLGGVEKFIEGVDFIIEFDHHYNEDVLGNLCFDDVQKAATSQIIFDIVRKAKLKTDQDVIDLLTLAIITDTGNFKYVRNSTVFKDSAELVEAGANMTHLVNLLSNKDKKTVLVESKAIYKAEFFYKGRLAVAVIKHDDYKKLDGRGEMTLSLLAQIHGVEYVVLLKEQKENQIAESLGGGGHLCAAGAVMSDSLENVYNKIINIFKGV